MMLPAGVGVNRVSGTSYMVATSRRHQKLTKGPFQHVHKPTAATTDLVRAEQRPAELPGPCRRLGPVQPLLGQGLVFHVWVKVQLVESLAEERESSETMLVVGVDKSGKMGKFGILKRVKQGFIITSGTKADI